jgi:hypothetical protein
MKLNIDIKRFLVSAALLCIFISSTGFIKETNQKKFFSAETVVSIVQENDGFTVSVKSIKNINIRFYMFTVEGRLIKELNIYGSKKISISPLEKGIYIYDFFTNDERLKNGKIELR